MYWRLLNSDQIAPIPVALLQPPFLNYYKSNQTYEYHAGASGHNIKSFSHLKGKSSNL